MMYSRVPSYHRSTSRWRGVVLPKPTSATKASPYSSVKGSFTSSLCGGLQGDDRNLYKVGAFSTTELEAPNDDHGGSQLISGGDYPSRVPTNPRVTSSSMEWMGNANSLGGSVDQDLLPRFPEGKQVWVAREGDLEAFQCLTMEERELELPTRAREEGGLL